MIGVPTGTVSPSGTISFCTTPAKGDGSSTSDLAVSISTRMSLMATVSPSLTFQVTISASVRPSPTSGSLNSAMGVSSEVERAVDGVEHAVEVGEVVLLDPRRGVRRVEGSHAEHRRLEGVEALLGDPGGHLGTEAEVDVGLVGDHGAAGPAYGVVDGLQVERRQGAEVDDLERPALARGRLGGLQCRLHGRAVGQH